MIILWIKQNNQKKKTKKKKKTIQQTEKNTVRIASIMSNSIIRIKTNNLFNKTKINL